MNLSQCPSQRCSCEIVTARYSKLSKRWNILPSIVYVKILAFRLISINIIAHLQALMSTSQVVMHAVLHSMSTWMKLWSSNNWYMCTQFCCQHIDVFLFYYLVYVICLEEDDVSSENVFGNTRFYVDPIGMWTIKYLCLDIEVVQASITLWHSTPLFWLRKPPPRIWLSCWWYEHPLSQSITITNQKDFDYSFLYYLVQVIDRPTHWCDHIIDCVIVRPDDNMHAKSTVPDSLESDNYCAKCYFNVSVSMIST